MKSMTLILQFVVFDVWIGTYLLVEMIRKWFQNVLYVTDRVCPPWIVHSGSVSTGRSHWTQCLGPGFHDKYAQYMTVNGVLATVGLLGR